MAEDIRIKTERFDHPIVKLLLRIGEKNEPQLTRGKKIFLKTYQTRLRWIGAFLATARIYPQLDKVADAVFVSVYRDLGKEKQFKEAKVQLDVQDDLLFALDSLLKILSPII